MNTAGPQPRVWVLTGHKAGDNNQLLALADALGWGHRRISLRYRRTELLTNLLLRTTLMGLRADCRSALAPPWPDLVLTAGRRNEPVARWIRRSSGDDALVVHAGRPWSPLRNFDLVVSTPQYNLPAGERVLVNDLPLLRQDPQRMEAARLAWEPRLRQLRRPWIALLVGGDSGAYVFDAALLRRLGAAAQQLAEREGAALLVTTSARTPVAAEAILRAAIGVPAWWHRWSPGGKENPYHAFLALADAFVVTGESVSMLAEACARGKPVHVFDPRPAGGAPWWCRPAQWRWKPLTHRLGQLAAPRRLRRDVPRLVQGLVDAGHACWLGEDPTRLHPPSPEDDLQRTVKRVRQLLEERRAGGPPGAPSRG